MTHTYRMTPDQALGHACAHKVRPWRFKQITSFVAFILVSVPCFAGVDDMAADNQKRNNLRLIAHSAGCSYFVSPPYKEISPSTTDVAVWKTCWVNTDDYWGHKYLSSIYLYRVDCSAKQFAIVDSAFFYGQFWQGGDAPVPKLANTSDWRPASKAFREIQKICTPGKYQNSESIEFIH